MMFKFAPPSNRTSSTMFFLTCIYITAIWLSIFIVRVSTLKCLNQYGYIKLWYHFSSYIGFFWL